MFRNPNQVQDFICCTKQILVDYVCCGIQEGRNARYMGITKSGEQYYIQLQNEQVFMLFRDESTKINVEHQDFPEKFEAFLGQCESAPPTDKDVDYEDSTTCATRWTYWIQNAFEDVKLGCGDSYLYKLTTNDKAGPVQLTASITTTGMITISSRQSVIPLGIWNCNILPSEGLALSRKVLALLESIGVIDKREIEEIINEVKDDNFIRKPVGTLLTGVDWGASVYPTAKTSKSTH